MTKQLTQNAILDRILKFGYVNWRQLLPIQPGNLKQIYNYSHLEQSIHKHGFALPFAVWEDVDGNIYTVDGHTRIEVLSNIEGVPEELPAFWVNAKDREDAAKILLEVYNQKHNPIDAEVMLQWLEVEEIALEEIATDSLNIAYTVEEEGEADQGQGAGGSSTVIKLEYTEDDYEQVREGLSRIAETPEQAVLQLLKL